MLMYEDQDDDRLEFVFFSNHLRHRFLQWLTENGVAYHIEDRQGDSEIREYLVFVPDDLDDDLDEAMEALYDDILDDEADEIDSEDDAHHLVGVQYTRADDGSVAMVRLPPQLVNEFACVQPEILQELVQCVADGVINPDNRPLCKR